MADEMLTTKLFLGPLRQASGQKPLYFVIPQSTPSRVGILPEEIARGDFQIIPKQSDFSDRNSD